MSAGHKETPRDTTCQSGAVVFFSNPLMSDVESDWSPIHDAAFNGRVLALQRLIAQVNSSTVDGQTPLSEACALGHVTCVSLLLQHGATPLGTSYTSFPIHRAAAKGHSECIEPLVQYGADVDQYVDQLGTPLHVACSNQHLSTARKLLQLGASVNSSVSGGDSVCGDSLLHIAARLSNPELVSVLLDHGADHTLRNSEGKRPLDLTTPNSLVERLLRQAGGVSPLMQLCRLHIRKTVGKQRLGRIHGLHLPTEVKQYLLYQSDPADYLAFQCQISEHFTYRSVGGALA
ncbi:ankyrin repeat and SOCS box protein 9-like isoform X2 [Micropterus dolomieu]|uniref:ankyrin repeat and SOCS box protein 9-like isoform X2 n=1 Tax=Micropterus dolomieu TaxID=147949 RepID=UPI001E8D7E84|nr:ankyrin repeat and SOCS box protein 9-like isoform X2 [Micropterus dolomieu]